MDTKMSSFTAETLQGNPESPCLDEIKAYCIAFAAKLHNLTGCHPAWYAVFTALPSWMLSKSLTSDELPSLD